MYCSTPICFSFYLLIENSVDIATCHAIVPSSTFLQIRFTLHRRSERLLLRKLTTLRPRGHQRKSKPASTRLACRSDTPVPLWCTSAHQHQSWTTWWRMLKSRTEVFPPLHFHDYHKISFTLRAPCIIDRSASCNPYDSVALIYFFFFSGGRLYLCK